MTTKLEKLEQIKTTTDAHKFCATCGQPMSLRRFEQPRFDPATGEQVTTEQFVWGCVAGEVGHDWIEV